jgi:cholesterol transport system auxiliary component
MQSTIITSKLFFIMMSVAVLSSCSLFSPVKIEAPTRYMINSPPPYVYTKKTSRKTLLVLTPVTQSVYNTTQMAYAIKPHQIAYFSKNEWAENPSEMIQPLLTQTLRNTHSFHAVASQPFTGHYDYVLSTQILQLKQNFTCYPPVLQMKVNAQLINASTNRIIATQLFSEEWPMVQRNPYAGVVAANHATNAILGKIAVFCGRAVRMSHSR